MERLTTLPKARGAVEHEPARRVAQRAERGLAADAVPALPARGDVARAHVVAGLDGLHGGADLLDHAGRLVAEHDGERVGIVAGDHVQVTVTDPVGHPTDEHLVGPGLQHLHVLDHEGLLHLVEHGRRRLRRPSRPPYRRAGRCHWPRRGGPIVRAPRTPRQPHGPAARTV